MKGAARDTAAPLRMERREITDVPPEGKILSRFCYSVETPCATAWNVTSNSNSSAPTGAPKFSPAPTTFVTMAYIVFVNPSILHEAGMPFKAVVAATCFCAAFGSIAMGVFARYPIALAPGMGLNAYFTYTVVKGMGVPWETALGAVFLSGVAFLILTLIGIRAADL